MSNIHPADLWWENSVVKSFQSGWLSRDVFNRKSSCRFCALREFHRRWLAGKIKVDNVPNEIVIFAPSESLSGFVRRPPQLSAGTVFLYLAPQVEYDSQKDANYYIAHELAHIELGHPDITPDSAEVLRPACEVAADRLAAEWGFPKRRRGRPLFERLVHPSK